MSVTVAKLDITRHIMPECVMTVRIVNTKEWHARLWIATRLFKLGAAIMNTEIKFEGQEN